jgi:hypothetical protein
VEVDDHLRSLFHLLGLAPICSADAISLWMRLARPGAGAIAVGVDAFEAVAAVRGAVLPGVGIQRAAAISLPATPILMLTPLLPAVLAPSPQLR